MVQNSKFYDSTVMTIYGESSCSFVHNATQKIKGIYPVIGLQLS